MASLSRQIDTGNEERDTARIKAIGFVGYTREPTAIFCWTHSFTVYEYERPNWASLGRYGSSGGGDGGNILPKLHRPPGPVLHVTSHTNLEHFEALQLGV